MHGQSVMVRHLVNGLREKGQVDLAEGTDGTKTAPIGFVHVNPQLATDLADIGRWRPAKILRVFAHVFEAIRAKFRYGLDTFYFVPAPPKREALYRDWAVLFLCQPFFCKLVLHWHCIGQREFFAKKLTAPERWLAHLCYGRAALSIALSKYSEEEASIFRPIKSVVVPNGIPDPCPEFDAKVWPERQKRAALRASEKEKPQVPPLPYEVLFVAGRLTPKGLFDSMEAIKLANLHAHKSGSLQRFRLTVPGRLRMTPSGRATNRWQKKLTPRKLREHPSRSASTPAGRTRRRKRRFIARPTALFFQRPIIGKLRARAGGGDGAWLRGDHDALASRPGGIAAGRSERRRAAQHRRAGGGIVALRGDAGEPILARILSCPFHARAVRARHGALSKRNMARRNRSRFRW